MGGGGALSFVRLGNLCYIILGEDRLGTIYFFTKKSWYLRAIWLPQSFSEGNLGSAKFSEAIFGSAASKRLKNTVLCSKYV
jgi:hypothetical protein